MVIMKRLSATLAAGATSLTFTDAAMNSNSIIEIYAVDMDVYPTNQQQTGEHSVTVTFDAQMDDVNVVCLINNVMSLSQPEAASNVTYDNTESGMEAENVQAAIDELSQPKKASNITYDNTESGLEAENVQAAIDELAQSGGGSGGDIYDKDNDVIIGKWIDGRPIKRHWHQWNSHWSSTGAKVSPLSLVDLGADFVISVYYFDLVRKISMPLRASGCANNDGTGNFNLWLNDYFSSNDQNTALIYDYIPVIE